MPGRTKQRDGDVLTDLESAIPRIFDQAQVSIANHQKNFVALHKLHTEAAQHTEPVNNGRTIKLTGERKFEDIFTCMLMRVLPIKKGVGPADRIVKFVGGYVRFVNDKAAEEKDNANNSDEEDPDEDTTASRFIARLLKFLLKGFLAKEKFVRYRVLYTVAEMVSHLGAIDEEVYEELRSALLERVHDKENAVRVQVVLSLSKLARSEDPTEITEGESVLEVLFGVLAHDSSPEVRRAALLNMLPNALTIPHILARTRDTDTTMRKLVYSAILDHNATLDEEDHKDAPKVRTKEENELVASGIDEDVKPDLNSLENDGSGKSSTGKQNKQMKRRYIGPTHPRALSIAQRELIVRNGLGDRESSVRATAEALVGTWVDVVNVGLKFEEDVIKEEVTNDQSLAVNPTGNEAVDQCVAFLKLFGLENEVASNALLSVFASRPEIYDGLEFDNPYWASLTPERAFLARVFVNHCCASKNAARLEATLPVVTALAFRVQEAYNDLVDRVRELEEKRTFARPEELVKEEDEKADREFIISEMLTLAINLDYSDEIGRRKMFQLMRDMLSQNALPERLLTKCLDVLRELSGERDLIRIMVEIIQDLRDRGDDDEEDGGGKDPDAEIDQEGTPASARPPRAHLFNNKKPEQLTPEQQAQKDEIDLRCLSLCIGVLERVNSKLEDNSTLDGVLVGLIVPAVRRNEVAFHQKGLVCLGLCSLIDRNLALGSFSMYFKRATSNLSEELKMSVLQVMFDMLMVHEHDFLQRQGETPQQITDLLVTRLIEETSSKVKALLAMGISKLVLCGMVTDIKAIKNLIITYLSPDTVDNQELRQCLTFFFPRFCYSSAANQIRLREIFIETFMELSTLRRRLDDDEVISATQVVALFVDLTDPLKLIQVINAKGKAPATDESVQVDLASDVLKALLDKKNNFEKEDKRVLTHMLSKLHIPDTVDDDKIRTLKLLIHSVQTRRPLRDATSNNALRKFDTAISKKFETQLEGFSEEEYRKLSELQELFEFLDDIIPEDDEGDDTDVPRRKGRKRRSGSIATTSTESLRQDSPASFPRDRLPQAKRRRISLAIDGFEELEGSKEGTPPPENPTRTLPKRNAAIKKPVINVISDESDIEEVQPTRKRPPPKPRQPQRKRAEDIEEAQLDEDISRLLSSRKVSAATTAISSSAPNMEDSEEEEDEVNESLLVEED
ncbi:Nuclear condensing complex subunit [Amanita muscaria]